VGFLRYFGYTVYILVVVLTYLAIGRLFLTTIILITSALSLTLSVIESLFSTKAMVKWSNSFKSGQKRDFRDRYETWIPGCILLSCILACPFLMSILSLLADSPVRNALLSFGNAVYFIMLGRSMHYAIGSFVQRRSDIKEMNSQ
jgi:hypothetical protein